MRLAAYSGCQDLLSGLRTATAQQVGPYGLNGPQIRTPIRLGDSPYGKDDASSAYSPTNVQVPGVDEPDLVKTDGHRIVALGNGRLQVIDPATRKITGSLSLPSGSGYPESIPATAASNLLLQGDHALVIAIQAMPLAERGPGRGPFRPGGGQVRIFSVDLSSAQPRITATTTFTGQYVAARQVGSVARIVLRSVPRITFPPPGPEANPDLQSMTAANRQVVAKAPLSDWLPQYEVDAGGAKRSYQVPCEQVSHPPKYTGTSMLTVLTLDLSSPAPGSGDPVALVADGGTVYAGATSLYVSHTATQPPPAQPSRPIRPQQGVSTSAPELAGISTDLYKFDISGSGRPRYLAAGSVPGTLLSSYSMSEYQGDLRIVTTSGAPSISATGATTSVYVLAQHGPALERAGSVGGIGKGERVDAVRFLGPTGYVVTFRAIDPIYTLDLHDPAHPAITGSLNLEGYSSYLHPVAADRLLGVGVAANARGQETGTQLTLFDTSGGQARAMARLRLPDSIAEADYDPHAFLYWPPTGLTVLPIMATNAWASKVLVLTVTPSAVHQIGTVQQPGTPQIRRSLLVGGSLWTFSDRGAQANDPATLASQAWLPY
jgi:hypothetical protein